MALNPAVVRDLITKIQERAPGAINGNGNGNGNGELDQLSPCELAELLRKALEEGSTDNALGEWLNEARRLAFFEPVKLYCRVTTDNLNEDEGRVTLEPVTGAGASLSSTLNAVDALLPGWLLSLVGSDLMAPNTPLTERFDLNNEQTHPITRMPLPFVGHMKATITEFDDFLNGGNDRLGPVEISASKTGENQVRLRGSGGSYDLHYVVRPLAEQIHDLLGCGDGEAAGAQSALSRGRANQLTLDCDDGGRYFFRVEPGTRHCAWFGFHPDGSWANVFWGQLAFDGLMMMTIQGDWCDVPFGRAAGSGQIALRFELSPGGFRRLRATGGFGGSTWTKSRIPLQLPENLPAGRRDAEAGSVSGVWTTDTGAQYYIRELPPAGPGEAPRVFWYAVRPDHTAVHVARGTRDNRTIAVEWIDVPPSQAWNIGTLLELELTSDTRMEKRNQSHNFGASVWEKQS